MDRPLCNTRSICVYMYIYKQESLTDANVSARQQCRVFASYLRPKLENRLLYRAYTRGDRGGDDRL